MKKTLTLSELQAFHVQLKAVALSDVPSYKNTVTLHGLARRAKQTLLSFKLPDDTIAEDFLDTIAAYAKKVTALEKRSHEEGNGNPDKQRYVFEKLLKTDGSVEEIRDQQEAFWKQKVTFEFEPIYIDLDEIEASEKYNNRLDDKYQYSFDRVWPKAVPVDWRGNSLQRNPKQDFIELIEEGFIVTEDLGTSFLDSLSEKVVKSKANRK